MSYRVDVRCANCGRTFSNLGILIRTRVDMNPCPNCGCHTLKLEAACPRLLLAESRYISSFTGNERPAPLVVAADDEPLP